MNRPFQVVSVVAAFWLAAFSVWAAGDARPMEPDSAAKSDRIDHPSLPTLFLVGDSTVRTGTRGMLGWGDPIAAYFDKTKINVANRAIGGRSSRTFRTEGRWEKVLAEMKAGDFVLVQFGHNDGGEIAKGTRPRASLKGNGDESVAVVVEATGKAETVHSFGWYLRRYAVEAKAKGATPIVCSLIPRKIWKDGKVVRAGDSYGKWAKEAAKAAGAEFIDLNEIIARRYEKIGPEKVEALFADEHTHTTPAGAEVNAACVVAGIKALNKFPLAGYLSEKGEAVPAFDAAAQ